MTVSISPTNLNPEIVKNSRASDDDILSKNAAVPTNSNPVPHDSVAGTIIIRKSK
jgi:hypothetical protein